jgi:hypothetical protein
MKEILLTQEKVAIVDDEDYEYINQWKWQAHKHRETFYAWRTIRKDGKKITIQMHREIMGFLYCDGRICDHKNRNGLDNRKSNLRNANSSMNSYNRKINKNNHSQYRGVSWRDKARKWIVQVGLNGRQIYGGRFSDIISAAKAYDKIVESIRGNDAILNFPNRRIE